MLLYRTFFHHVVKPAYIYSVNTVKSGKGYGKYQFSAINDQRVLDFGVERVDVWCSVSGAVIFFLGKVTIKGC